MDQPTHSRGGGGSGSLVRDASWWPITCPKCKGPVVPLSDYGEDGAAVIFKAWACMDEVCSYAVRVDKGEVSYGRKRDREHSRDRRPA